MPWAAAGAVVGAVITSSAAGDAADQQSQSAAAATAAQQQAAAQMRSDLSPWTTSGGAAQTRLNQFLGIGGAGGTGVTSMGLQTGLSPDQVRQQLTSRYTRAGAGAGGGANTSPAVIGSRPGSSIRTTPMPYYENGAAAIAALGPLGAYQYFQDQSRAQGILNSDGSWNAPTDYSPSTGVGGASATIDEEGLNAAIQKYYDEQKAQDAQAASDPNYGSLLRAYHNGAEFDSGPAFSFTGENLASDPGYKFGLDQGTQGIERGQASRGNFLSGSAMKELDRFNQDYAGTKFNDAFTRASSTYGTNLNRRQNEWTTNRNSYNQDRNSIYDFLTGVSRTGQNSAAQVGTSNNRAAEVAGNNLTTAGTAQSAATVAGGNALQSGINSAVNNYNSTNNLNSAAGWNNMLSRQGGGYSGYTGYTGGSNDPIANLNTQNGWTV